MVVCMALLTMAILATAILWRRRVDGREYLARRGDRRQNERVELSSGKRQVSN